MKKTKVLSVFLAAAAGISACMSLTGCVEDDVEIENISESSDTSQFQTESADETSAETTSETTAETVNESQTDDLDLKAEKFEVTSESLSDGVWNTVISSSKGSDVSPQLSWEPVEGAEGYAIYMVDLSADYWMHWKSNNVTETTLAQGWADSSEYIGPYPPGGTHTYNVYVFALKKLPAELNGIFDDANTNWKTIASSLDTIDDTEGNILSYGMVSGTFTA